MGYEQEMLCVARLPGPLACAPFLTSFPLSLMTFRQAPPPLAPSRRRPAAVLSFAYKKQNHAIHSSLYTRLVRLSQPFFSLPEPHLPMLASPLCLDVPARRPSPSPENPNKPLSASSPPPSPRHPPSLFDGESLASFSAAACLALHRTKICNRVNSHWMPFSTTNRKKLKVPTQSE